MSKDPFAKPDLHTYKYPEPMDDPQREGELTVQYEARKESIDPEEVGEGHWIRIRIPRSRGDVDAVADFTQSLVVLGDNGDGAKWEQRIARGNRAVFELLVDGWSFDREANGASYTELTGWSGEWVSACLADAVRKGTARDFGKRTTTSSEEPGSSPDKPPEPVPEASV